MENYLYKLTLELFFPSSCSLCQKVADVNFPICEDCLGKIDRILSAGCDVCGKAFTGEAGARLCGDCIRQKPNFDKARAFARFQEPMVQIIHEFKYRRGFYYLDWFVSELTRVFEAEFANENFDLIIPIPLHWLRLIRRGYNQAQVIAKPLSKKIGIPLAVSGLIRTKNTSSQVGLSPAKRKENVKNSFKVKNEKQIEGKNILLIDDVITTGMTVDEAARTLKKAGAKRVCVLALART